MQEQLITSKGYPFERHNAITSDGYIIEMHRIPHGREDCKEPCHRQPILLMSGLLGDSSNFVLDFPKQSIGYVLAGQQVRRMDGKRTRFHEHSKYDVPAQIEYILKKTGRKDLLYLGVSQGTLLFFTMMSERPQYNEKVKAFAGLAPFNKVSHMNVDSLAMLMPFADKALRMAYTLGTYEIMPQGFPLLPLARSFCALPTRAICSLLGDEFGNLGSKYMNMLVESKKATKFDYGPVDNKIYYGQEEPPEYQISNVMTDVGIFWSRGDHIISPANVRELIEDLGPWVKKNHFIDDPYYTHVHFAMALNNPTKLYKDLLQFLDKYATSS
ncbi:hypothetical protein MTO96_032547 [Rhipicephalus appendiculatus]